MSHPRVHASCASYPLTRSLPRTSPHCRTFPAQDTRSKQGHAFANRFSRNWRLLEKDKQRLRGHPNDQQEGRRSHCERYKRPEMMIVRLPTQWAFFFHACGGRFLWHRLTETNRVRRCIKPKRLSPRHWTNSLGYLRRDYPRRNQPTDCGRLILSPTAKATSSAQSTYRRQRRLICCGVAGNSARLLKMSSCGVSAMVRMALHLEDVLGMEILSSVDLRIRLRIA